MSIKLNPCLTYKVLDQKLSLIREIETKLLLIIFIIKLFFASINFVNLLIIEYL